MSHSTQPETPAGEMRYVPSGIQWVSTRTYRILEAQIITLNSMHHPQFDPAEDLSDIPTTYAQRLRQHIEFCVTEDSATTISPDVMSIY